MGFGRQLKLLLWKNYTLRRRQPIRVVVELLIPLVLFLILAAVRLTRDLQHDMSECHFDQKPMPSAGLLPFLQGMVCTANNTCYNSPRSEEDGGVLRVLNSSVLSEVLLQTEMLLSDESLFQTLATLYADVADIRSWAMQLQNTTLLSNCSLSLSGVAVNETALNIELSRLNISIPPDIIFHMVNSSFDLSKILYSNQQQFTGPYNISALSLLLQSQLSGAGFGQLLQPNYGGFSNMSALFPLFQNLLYGNSFSLDSTSLALYYDLLNGYSTNASAILNQLLKPQLIGGDYSNLSSIALVLRDNICDNSSSVLIRTSDPVDSAVLQNVTDILCNLTLSEFQLLTEAIVKQVNFSLLLLQLQECVNSSEPFTNETVQYFQSMLARLNNTALPDVNVLQQQINAFSHLTSLTSVGNVTNGTELLSLVLCGTSQDLFASDEQQDVENVLQSTGSDSSSANKYVYDNSTTEFCNDLFTSFESSSVMSIMWSQLKPIVRGRLLYTPDTVVTRRIVQQANYTFELLGKIKELAADWTVTVPNITTFLYDPNFLQSVNTIKQMATYGLLGPNSQSILKVITWLSDNGQNVTSGLVNFLDSTFAAMKFVSSLLECFEFNKFEPYTTEEDLVTQALLYINQDLYWAGIVFDLSGQQDNHSMPGNITFKIRMDVDMVDDTENFKVTDSYWKPGPRYRPLPDMKYIVYGFAYLQDMVEHAIIRLVGNTSMDDEIGIIVQQFPYPCYIVDSFTSAITTSMPLFLTIAWILTAALIVKGIVYEKETRLKEVMKVMGLSNGVHWLAWFITSLVMMVASIILLVIILKAGRVTQYSSIVVLFIFLLSFAIATISQCFLFSVFFNKANLAAVCAGIFYFCGYLPYSICVTWDTYMKPGYKILVSLISTVAFGFGCGYIGQYEQQGVGAQFSNMATSAVPEDSYNLMGCIVMMLADSVIYWLIAWYIETVFPGAYGVPQPWYFFLKKSYWLGQTSGVYVDSTSLIEMQQNAADDGNFEREPVHLKLGVAIHGLRKTYKNGAKAAVDGLNASFYEGQITAFLGHNGAGKTTTMSILTGLLTPSAGTAYVYGLDIRKDINTIRKSMGMCPQQNVLFDQLTVEEHVWFYASLKGASQQEIDVEMVQLVKNVGLTLKTDEISKNLSGGMKRKLSIAIAFVAGSKLVILDEPTAGVDPYARRSIWDLLLKYKEGRTILLSTHFMDEADILGDRILIISEGKMRCGGSGLFLKSRYGSGYYLTFVRKTFIGESENDGSKKPLNGANLFASDASKVLAFIQEVVPGAQLAEDNGREFVCQLPDDKDSTSRFEKLFRNLDASLNDLHLSSYGISDTTLEEVFLNVTDSHSTANGNLEVLRQSFSRPVQRSSLHGGSVNSLFLKEASSAKSSNSNLTTMSDSGSSRDLIDDRSDLGSVGRSDDVNNCSGAGAYKITGAALLRRQMFALFVKRFLYVIRDKKGFICQIVLPAIFICLAMIVCMINPPTPQEPAMEIHPWLMTPTQFSDSRLSMFFSSDNDAADWATRCISLLLTEPGVGTRCMNPAYHTIPNYECAMSEATHVWEYDNSPPSDAQCSCSTGYQECPSDAGNPVPPVLYLPTTDALYNLSGRSISDWIVKTTEQFTLRRYGGLSFDGSNVPSVMNASRVDKVINNLATTLNISVTTSNVASLIQKLTDNLGAVLKGLVTSKTAKVWFENKGYVAMVSYMNVMDNLILRAHLRSSTDVSKYGIVVVNHPMNRTQSELQDFLLQESSSSVLIAVSVIFAMSFVPASFILFLVEDRVSKSKHLQFVSGVNPLIYWVANFCWDLVNYVAAAIICILIFLAFQQKAFVSAQNLPCLVALLVLYGWAVTPMMYPVSYFAKIPSAAFVGLSCFNVFVGVISSLATFILQVLILTDSNAQDLKEVNDVLMQVFLVLPHYCLGRGLIDMINNQLISDTMAALGQDVFKSPFQWDIVGRNLFSLAMLGLFFFLLNICIQYKFWVPQIRKLIRGKRGQKRPIIINENQDILDEDVARERDRVLAGQTSADIIVLDSLSKVYKSIIRRRQLAAVKELTLGIERGECFGLLGVNGAGKTTTFKMLTGDTDVTYGDALLNNYSILTDMVKVNQNLGYCPQFDALCSLLTVKEHLVFFSRLRGVPEEEVNKVAAWGVWRLGLKPHVHKKSKDLSGGNKRKLSTAIALVGNPPVIFLDEPTTGMDPGAKRHLWDCIKDIQKQGRSIVLTSHSMEECEALCNRLAIMVNGRFQCLGSVQHLKNRFGGGYYVTIRVSSPTVVPVAAYMHTQFPAAVLRESYHHTIEYQLPPGEDLANVFGRLEAARDELCIDDYSVCQTTLDQVFINFAKKQQGVDNFESEDADQLTRGETCRSLSGVTTTSLNV